MYIPSFLGKNKTNKYWQNSFPSQYLLVSCDWPSTVKACHNLSWYKSKETLVSYLAGFSLVSAFYEQV